MHAPEHVESLLGSNKFDRCWSCWRPSDVGKACAVRTKCNSRRVEGSELLSKSGLFSLPCPIETDQRLLAGVSFQRLSC